MAVIEERNSPENMVLEDSFLFKSFDSLCRQSQSESHPSNRVLDISPKKIWIKSTLRAANGMRHIISDRCSFSSELTNARHK